MRRLRSLLTQALIFLVLLELGLQAVVRLGLLDVSLPSYRARNAWSFWVDIDPHHGVWHLPHAEFRHSKACFSVPYRANAFGMRDRETKHAHSGKRVVVLGDSFVEGWGIAEGKRLTDLLERGTRIEHLNFGTSGDFDPVQYWQLYRTRAKGFEHDAVLVMILPNNDFPEGGIRDERGADARWRPRLTGTFPNYRVTYPPRRFEPDPYSWGRFATNLPGEFWLTYRVGMFLVAYLSAAGAQDGGGVVERSRYHTYTRPEFDRLRYAIEQIVEEAGTRKVLVATIPRPDDFAAAQTGKTAPLPAELAQVVTAASAQYLDLLPPMLRGAAGKPERWFLSCDGHWSEAGHAEAARIVGDAWSSYYVAPLPAP